MLRDVFYYGNKPNAHPREQHAENLEDARQKCTTEHFWIINEFCDYRNFDWDFDFEFLPDEDVWAEEHNNVWPSQWQKDSGTWLCAKTPTDIIIYRGDVDPIKRKNEKTSNWVLLDTVDEAKFDFSWHPDPTDPPYIYKWGCKFFPAELKHVLEYVVSGATEEKYMNTTVELLPQHDLWVEHVPVDKRKFDMSWRPNPIDNPYIYVWGNKYYDGKTAPTLEYHAPGATDIKHMPDQLDILPDMSNWEILEDIELDKFDFSWRPNPKSPPYIYVWGNQWNSAEEKTSVRYVVDGATECQYMDKRTVRKPCLDNWIVPDNIDTTGFDFSWEPNPFSPDYIYEFATQWQKTGGPQYVVPGATEKTYVDFQKVKRLPSVEGWEIPDYIDSSGFDFSWHPDDTSPPYSYVFATQWAFSGGPVYTVPGATEIKYVEDQVANALPNKKNWDYDPTLIDEDSIDFSWHPYVEDQPYIYQFGTQWQKTGGPRYIAPGATKESPIKYIDTRIIKTKRLPSYDNWHFLINDYEIEQFDYSWHPDDTEEPYIYVFGNKYYPAEEMPTIEYHVEGATQRKYVHDTYVTLAPNKKKWIIPKNIDQDNFDFSWLPHPDDAPYIYEFATQWQKTGGPKYVVEGATDVKYINHIKATHLPDTTNWIIPDNITVEDFDFSWHPDATAPAYTYYFPTQWALSGGPIYKVPGAIEVRYEESPVAKVSSNKENWEYDPSIIDEDSFDFSWHPYADDRPYIYEFGTQWQKNGGPRYITPGADKNSPVKYIDTRVLKANRLPNKNKFKVINNVAIKDFDYSWHPDNTEEPYNYVFGNNQYNAEDMPTLEYSVEGATQTKYVTDIIATLDSNKSNWEILHNINENSFDFSWVPNPNDPPYIYVFGNQWHSAEKMPTVKYVVPDAAEIKYVSDIIATLNPNKTNWTVVEGIKIKDFDYSWIPDPHDPPYIYVFGNNQYSAEEMPTVEYKVDGATEKKYVNEIVAMLAPNMTNWEIPETIDVSKFDFSWVPHPKSPPYIYQFGTLVDDIWINDGPKYITPGNDGFIVSLENSVILTDEISYPAYYIKTTLADLVNEHPTEMFWALNKNINYDSFDFSWKPTKDNLFNVTVFGSPESEMTHTYFVNAVTYLEGHTGLNFMQQEQELDEKYLAELFVKPDMFYVDRGNSESNARFEALKAKYGTRIQKTRYLNSWVDTIKRCINRATSDLVWVLNSELDYTGFDFEYYPNPWQLKMVHVFGTQWSHWGTTFLVNRESFVEDTKYINIVEHLSTLNFVKSIRAKATECVYDVILIDHGNIETNNILEQIKAKAGSKTVTVVPYNNSYLDTIRDIVSKQQQKKENYLWICSSICDYTDIDLSYICDPFAKDQLHVFPSGTQKFGDTFFIDVNKTKEIINDIESLTEFNKINFNNSLKAKRLPEPIIVVNEDTHVNSMIHAEGFPYVTVITADNTEVESGVIEPMSVWSPDTKNIIVTSTGATRIVIPKEASDYVKRELYDYPYIKRASKLALSKPLDIVFLSNGEAGADENYEHLLNVTKGLKNRVVRVDGITGRAKAYHAAADASETPWFFTVFAKLKVSPKFDWNWQPDRMQVSKHYIFHAKNPVNGLTYGHQAMIAYNKKLTLANEGQGLDFTLDDEHETVPLISGTAHYNTDPFSTWRTAFREVLKLRSDNSEDARVRLEAWLNKAEGNFAQYSIKGAVDADEYYDEVGGDFLKLKLSYEWAWLKDRFENS